MRKKLEQIVATHGSLLQHVIAVEEMGELQKEVTKFIRGKGNIDHLIEEIADVQIMLWQLMVMHDITDEEVEREIAFKVDRTLGGIE